jgi:hypothetical protein
MENAAHYKSSLKALRLQATYLERHDRCEVYAAGVPASDPTDGKLILHAVNSDNRDHRGPLIRASEGSGYHDYNAVQTEPGGQHQTMHVKS